MTKMSKIEEQTGADVVVQTLVAHGVTHVFGIPGAKIDTIFNGLVDTKIQTVVCRHEQNAAFMAGGIGRMTGKAGVCVATSGPGVSNLVTGVATANSEGDPVVALGGAVAVAESLKQVHQTMDSVSIMKPVTKFSASVVSPHAVSEVLSNAFRAAESGRPGSAFVSLPKDMMSAGAQARVLAFPSFSGYGPADSSALNEAAKIVSAAKNPVIFVGMLANKPGTVGPLGELITKLDAPVVGTFQAAGAVASHLFDNFGGRVGQIDNQPGDKLLAAADVVITVGYNPVEYDPSIWNKDNSRTIVHIDVLSADLDMNYCPTVELIGDLAQTLAALKGLISSRGKSEQTKKLLQEIVEQRSFLSQKAAQLNGAPVHPMRLIYELQKFLEPDVTLCSDVGSLYLWLARHLYSFRARQVLISNGQQSLGIALPWAIAASLVRPHEKVLSISGDGGFLFSAMELETAVRLKANIVHMVWIDNSYNMVAVQEIAKYGRVSGCDLGPVDTVKYAEAFGATGLVIRTGDEIAPVMKKAFDTSGPVIVGVQVDYSDNHNLFEMVRPDVFH